MKQKSSQKNNVRRLTVTAVLLALSTVLSLVKVWQMPLGGSVTLLSMVPVCLISAFYGPEFAIIPCFLYGLIQIFLGGVFSWGLTPAVLITCILLDYLLAYGLLFVSGIFRRKKWGIVWGVALACVLRFICHFLSGIVLWRSFEVFNNPYLYSLVYNGAYMLPELIITCIGVFLLFSNSQIKKLVKSDQN